MTMKETYNQCMRGVRYSVNDRLWLHNPCRKRGLSPKLQSPWVVTALSDIAYRICRGRKRPAVA